MITIGLPIIKQNDGDSYILYSEIVEDSQRRNLCFTTTSSWASSLTKRRVDAFVVGLIVYAIRKGQDIYSSGVISERLLLNLRKVVVPLLSSVYGYKPISISVDYTSDEIFLNNSVATGCSLGVDSFSTMLGYQNLTSLPSYNLTHYTYFNGSDFGAKSFENNHKSFLKNLQLVKSYADEKGIEVVTMETNLSSFYSDIPTIHWGLFCKMSMVIAFQKLFKKYIFASSYPIDKITLSEDDPYHYEHLLVPALSTESTELLVGQPNMTRVDKTKFISNFHETYKKLYVCWKDLWVNDGFVGPKSSIATTNYLNCTRCDKCLRTICTLDILGKAEQYGEIFDLKYWYSVKDDFLFQVLTSKDNRFYEEIADLIRQTNYPLSLELKKKLALNKFHLLRMYSFIKKQKMRVLRKLNHSGLKVQRFFKHLGNEISYSNIHESSPLGTSL